MALNRILDMDVGINNALVLKISALNISFNIVRNVDISANTAVITVFNAKEETRLKVLTKGNNVVLKAGYEDENNVGTIFSGYITNSSSRREGPDWVTEIQAIDLGGLTTNILKQTISLSFIAGTFVSTVISTLVGVMSVPIIGLENVSNIKLNNGFIYVGTISGALKKLQKILRASDAGLYFDNSEFVIYLLGVQDSKFGIVNISPVSGLIGSIEEYVDEGEEDDKKRIAFTSLMNAKIKPNSVIVLNTATTKGAFIVENVEFLGDNFGGEFVANVECVV